MDEPKWLDELVRKVDGDIYRIRYDQPHDYPEGMFCVRIAFLKFGKEVHVSDDMEPGYAQYLVLKAILQMLHRLETDCITEEFCIREILAREFKCVSTAHK